MLQAKGINSSTKEGKVRQITKKQQEKLLEQRKKEGNENALQKTANTSGIQGVNAI